MPDGARVAISLNGPSVQRSFAHLRVRIAASEDDQNARKKARKRDAGFGLSFQVIGD